MPSEEQLRSWNEGVHEFNRGAYWDAHHHWERDWNRLPFPEKQRIQGFIAACGFLHHLANGRTGPAFSLCRLALTRLDEADGAPPVAKMRVEIPLLHERLREVEDDPGRLPREIIERFKDLKGMICPT